MGRAELPAGGLQALMEVAQVASSPGPPAQRARAMVEPLHRVVPFDAAWIGLLHPDRREHFSLVKHGLLSRAVVLSRPPDLHGLIPGSCRSSACWSRAGPTRTSPPSS